MPELQTLLTGLAFGESPRWYNGRLWFSDFGAQEVVAVDLTGSKEVIAHVPGAPMGLGFLPDGRLLIVSMRDGLLLRREHDGKLVVHADLSKLSPDPWSDLVVDGRGNAYIGNLGFNFPDGEFAPGILVLVTPDGEARPVADGCAFANGMVVTPDNSTLILAESYGHRLTALDIDATGPSPTGGCGQTSAAVTLMAFALMPKTPSGMQTSLPNGVCAFAKGVRCCRPSISTAAALPACWEAWTEGHCF